LLGSDRWKVCRAEGVVGLVAEFDADPVHSDLEATTDKVAAHTSVRLALEFDLPVVPRSSCLEVR
jgi:hypothetical protein